MQPDVLTLFPEWFEWFRTQRHVRNAIEQGHEIRTFDPRATTPLSGGQVDDTPFGGGAGMVLRVDVIDHAIGQIYGKDSLEVRQDRRILALTPGGRMLDDAFVDELAAEPGGLTLREMSAGQSGSALRQTGSRVTRLRMFPSGSSNHTLRSSPPVDATPASQVEPSSSKVRKSIPLSRRACTSAAKASSGTA